MKADLKVLIRLRDWRVDAKRRILGRMLSDLDDLKSQARGLEREMADEQKIAGSLPDEAGRAYAGYARRVLERRAALAGAIAEAERAVVVAKDDVAQAYRDLKTVEIAQVNRERREATEAERRETIALDEIALQGFRRRAAEP